MPFSSIEKEFSLREKRISGAIQTSGTNFGLTYELDTEKEALSNVDQLRFYVNKHIDKRAYVHSRLNELTQVNFVERFDTFQYCKQWLQFEAKSDPILSSKKYKKLVSNSSSISSGYNQNKNGSQLSNFKEYTEVITIITSILEAQGTEEDNFFSSPAKENRNQDGTEEKFARNSSLQYTPINLNKHSQLGTSMLEISPRIEFLILSLPIFNPHESKNLPLCKLDSSIQRDILLAKELIWENIKGNFLPQSTFLNRLIERSEYGEKRISEKANSKNNNFTQDQSTTRPQTFIKSHKSNSSTSKYHFNIPSHNSGLNFSKSGNKGSQNSSVRPISRQTFPQKTPIRHKSSAILRRSKTTQKKPDLIPLNPVVGPIMVTPPGFTKSGLKKPRYSYIGQFNLQKNSFEGYGILRTEKSTHYEGEFVDSKLNGLGRKIDSNLNVYRGTFKKSTKHGFGILDRILEKTKYEGMFDHGVEHGYGREFIYKEQKFNTQIHKSSSLRLSMSQNLQEMLEMKHSKTYEEDLNMECNEVLNKMCPLDKIEREDFEEYYEGYWKLGEKTGIGFYYMKDKSSCLGDMVKGVLHGYGKHFLLIQLLTCSIGVYRWKNGKIYRGEWKKGKMEGFGEFKWPTGDFYVGHYKNDLKDGFGEFYW